MFRSTPRCWIAAAALALLLGGCTGPCEYIRNGFKVGPNYHRPPALVAEHWIDANDQRVRTECDSLAAWWTVLNDPLLNQLVVNAYQQNLTLREAGFRVLAARAQYGIAVGQFFPQRQDMTGSYTRSGRGLDYFSRWDTAFNLAWELDFWGRFRRAIIAADAILDSSVFNYDDVLVTLLGDVASNYVTIRTTQERMRLLEQTTRIQQDVYNFINAQLGVGVVTELDRAQAESDLKQSLAQLAQFRIDIRLAENRLCTLLGIPPVDLEAMLRSAPQTGIPTAPDYVVAGIPAELLRRRPDVRRAERDAAAQAELVGIAETDLYPIFSVSGSLGWTAAEFRDLFRPEAFNSNVSPSFRWNLLNYGRILNNMRFQDANFKALVAVYQQAVLAASEEVENGIITFLQAQTRAKLLQESVDAAYIALGVIVAQYENSVQGQANVNFTRYTVILQALIQQQDQWALARGQVDQGLIQVYRALGGGWQIRLGPEGLVPCPALLPDAPKATKPEEVPQPKPEPQPLPEQPQVPLPMPLEPVPTTLEPAKNEPPVKPPEDNGQN